MTTTEWCRKSIVVEPRDTGEWELRMRFLFLKDGSEAAAGSFVVSVHADHAKAEDAGNALLKWLINYTHLAVSSAKSGHLENEPLFPKKAQVKA